MSFALCGPIANAALPRAARYLSHDVNSRANASLPADHPRAGAVFLFLFPSPHDGE